MPTTGRGRTIEAVTVNHAFNTGTNLSAVTGVSVTTGDVVVGVGTWVASVARTCTMTSSGLTFTDNVNTANVTNGVIVSHCVIETPATITVTATVNSTGYPSLWVFVLRGVDNTAPVDVSGASGTLASSTTWTIPEITTNSARTFVIAVGHNNAVNAAVTGPTGWTTDPYNLASPLQSNAVTYREQLPQGATGNIVQTIASAGTCRYATIAFRAAT